MERPASFGRETWWRGFQCGRILSARRRRRRREGARQANRRRGASMVSFNRSRPRKAARLRSRVVSELQKNGVAWFGVSFADGGTASWMRDSLMSEVMPLERRHPTQRQGGRRRLDAAVEGARRHDLLAVRRHLQAVWIGEGSRGGSERPRARARSTPLGAEVRGGRDF